METTKLRFGARIKKAIFNFDEYEKFIVEPTKKAIKYFLEITLIFSLIITIALIYKMNMEINKVLPIVKSEFPEFLVANNELQMQDSKQFDYYFENLDFKIGMTDALDVENNDYENSLIALKDRIVLTYNGYTQTISYKDAQIDNISKESIINFFEEQHWQKIYISTGIIMLIIMFTMYTIIFLLDILTLTFLGLIINIIIRTTFKFNQILKISIYAMTLPMLLYLVYILLNTLLGVNIKYFQIAYNAISYIYLITVLLIIKSDIIKNTQELQKVLEEQKKVREELQKEKQEEEEQKKKEKEEEKDSTKDKKGKGKSNEDKETGGAAPQTEN